MVRVLAALAAAALGWASGAATAKASIPFALRTSVDDATGAFTVTVDGVVWFGQDSSPVYTGYMEWAPDTSEPYASARTSILARRERPQILLDDSTGSSYGTPRMLVTSAEDCYPAVDAGVGVKCVGHGAVGTDKSYTVLAELL